MRSRRSYGGVTAAEREHRRRSSLIDACLDIVGESGISALTLNAVSARAGLTKRYFYESFADTDELLTAALAGFFDLVEDRVLEHHLGSADLGLESSLELALDTLLDVLEQDVRLAHLYVQASSTPGLRRAREQAVDRFAALLITTIVGAERTPASDFIAHALVAGLTDALTRWLTGRQPGLDRAEVVRLCVTGARGMLQAEAAELGRDQA